MRSRLPIILWLFTCALGLAQKQEQRLSQRLDAKWDMSQRNYMDGKAFNGGGTMDFSKKAVGQNAFAYDQKVSSPSYTTRSFFGLKNPWFGKKVFDSNQADLGSKTLVMNADTKFDVKKMKVSEFALSDKKASTGNGVVPTPQYIAKSGTPGAMDQINDQLKKKNMSIDQVRDLLNKN